jgi:hypothetical protein
VSPVERPIVARTRELLVVTFLALLAVRGIRDEQRGVLGSLTDWYGDGLGLARTWGMFARPGDEKLVEVRARLDGEERTLAPRRDPSFLTQLRDMRMRKLRSRVARAGEAARLGEGFVRYYCAELPQPELVRLVEVNRDGSLRSVLLEARCAQ